MNDAAEIEQPQTVTSAERLLHRIALLLSCIAVALAIFIVGVMAAGWYFRDSVRDARNSAHDAKKAAETAQATARAQLRFSKAAVRERQMFQDASLRIQCRLLDHAGAEDKACKPKP